MSVRDLFHGITSLVALSCYEFLRVARVGAWARPTAKPRSAGSFTRWRCSHGKVRSWLVKDALPTEPVPEIEFLRGLVASLDQLVSGVEPLSQDITANYRRHLRDGGFTEACAEELSP